MIYRAIQLIQIFCAHGRTNGLTKVIQEVLADLKSVAMGLLTDENGVDGISIDAILIAALLKTK